MIHPSEIVYTQISASTHTPQGKPAKTLVPLKLVFAARWTGYTPDLSWNDRDERVVIRKFGVQEDLLITVVKVISRHGFRVKAITK